MQLVIANNMLVIFVSLLFNARHAAVLTEEAENRSQTD